MWHFCPHLKKAPPGPVHYANWRATEREDPAIEKPLNFGKALLETPKP